MITIEGDSTSAGVTKQYLTATADQKTIGNYDFGHHKWFYLQ